MVALAALIFGIIWIIKGEIKIRHTPWWDERIISSDIGRLLGIMMVISSLCALLGLISSELGWIFLLIVVVLPFVLGVAMSKKVDGPVLRPSQVKLPDGCPPGCNGANLRWADLYQADMHGADLRQADLREADLRQADFSKARLIGTDLHQADLREANLTGADLRGANLHNANLSGAILCKSDLSTTNLSEANLRRADLSEANLRWANLSGVRLTGIIYDNSTIWPEAFEPPPSKS